MDTYNQQVAAIQAQLSQLQQRTYQLPQPAQPLFQLPVHNVQSVDSLAGAEAILKEMPAGSSDIVAHSTEDIIYILARDKNNTPLPIKTARIEFIEAAQDPTGNVTRADLDAFKNQIMGEIRALVGQRGETE